MNEIEKYIVKRLDSIDEKVTRLLIFRAQVLLLAGTISVIINTVFRLL
jgi:hypothetical protein